MVVNNCKNKKMDTNNKNQGQNTPLEQELKLRIPEKPKISTLHFFCAVFLFLLVYYLFRYTEIDAFLITAVVALTGIVIELFSSLFTYLLVLIQSIPYIGPMIAGIITWPIFVTLNVAAYFVTLIVIRFKGMGMVKDARIITTIFLIGLLLGFILGRIF